MYQKIKIPKANTFTYLGVTINSDLNFNDNALNKFKNTQKSVFSLSFIGLSPNSIPLISSLLFYKTFCLSQFSYSIETTVINGKTRSYLNTCQNNLIRLMLGLNKFCHMSRILKCLKIFSFEDFYLFMKLSFLNTIKHNEISTHILIILF